MVGSKLIFELKIIDGTFGADCKFKTSEKDIFV